MNDAAALWFKGDGRFGIEPEVVAAPPRGRCTVEALFSAISPGTERLIYSQQVPAAAYRAMRCPYMAGQFPYPVKYGYSLVGRVTAGPRALRGRLVHVLHPHQSRCVVSSGDVSPLPEGLPPRRATLASNLETAITAVWDARIGIGDRVLVVGFGALGALVAQLISWVTGVDLVVTDTSPAKRTLASEMGFEARVGDAREAPFDVAINASGSGAGLQLALDHVGFEGRVVELSWHGTRAVPLVLGEGFHYERKSIVSSQVGHLPPERRARWDRARRKALVFRLLARPELDRHISRVLRFETLPSALPAWLGEPGADLTAVVAYRARER